MCDERGCGEKVKHGVIGGWGDEGVWLDRTARSTTLTSWVLRGRNEGAKG